MNNFKASKHEVISRAYLQRLPIYHTNCINIIVIHIGTTRNTAISMPTNKAIIREISTHAYIHTIPRRGLQTIVVYQEHLIWREYSHNHAPRHLAHKLNSNLSTVRKLLHTLEVPFWTLAPHWKTSLMCSCLNLYNDVTWVVITLPVIRS
jgi:hypothetical protein